MKSAEPKFDSKMRAERFVADLAGVAGPKKFYHNFIRHWNFFDHLLKDGETWPSIAKLLTDAGARHRRGQKISDGQLRMCNSRRKRDAARAALDDGREEMQKGESGRFSERTTPRSGPKDVVRHEESGGTNRGPTGRAIRTSRIGQRLEMMTKTRRGKNYDLED